MWPSEAPVGQVVLAFTDLENSSVLSEQLGVVFEELRNVHFELLREALQRFQGYEVETAGDSLFAVFASPFNAVSWAAQIQLTFMGHPWPPEVGALKVRIGLHGGEPFTAIDARTGRPVYRGPATNRAARVMSAAHGGQILLSSAVQAAMSALPSPLSLLDCGSHRLKGVGEEHLWQLLHPDLPTLFPPLMTLSPQRHNLPSPPTPFIGREGALSSLRELLQHPTTRLLTLVGLGGIGKTRMSLQLAESCLDDFKDGVWWVGLDQASNAAEMYSEIAQALRFGREATTPLRDQVHNYLRDRQLLLVLDNIEQIEGGAAVVRDLLTAGPQCRCLVTSRQILGLRQELVREITPLSTDESLVLLQERALTRGIDVDAHDVAVRRLCKHLEGIPLALELAASRLGLLSPQEVCDRLEDRFRLLRQRAPDQPARFQALKATIDWSYDLLSPDDQSVFCELAVFAGSFTLADVEAVSSAFDALESLDTLYRHSLLRRAEPREDGSSRYFMLELLNAYALDKLRQEPDEGREVRERHARYFAKRIGRSAANLRSRQEASLLQNSAADLDNARAALRWASSPQSGWSKEDLAGLCLALGKLLFRFGWLREAQNLFQIGLETLGPEGGASALRAALLTERAGAYYEVRQWEQAQAMTREALALWQAVADESGRAEATNLLGLIALRGYRDATAAATHFAQAAQLYQESAQEVGATIAQNNLGLALHQVGDKAGARQTWEAALAQNQRNGYLRGTAEVQVNLGVLDEEEGRFDEAWQRYQSALDIECRLHNQNGIARALVNLGEIAARREVWPQAVRLFLGSATLFERAGSAHLNYVMPFLKDAMARTSIPLVAWESECSEKSAGEIAAWALPEREIVGPNA